MPVPVLLYTQFGSVWLSLKPETRKLIVFTSTSDAPVKINSSPCSIYLTYRITRKNLRPLTMAAYTHPKHELISGPLAQKASQLLLPVISQWLSSHNSGHDLPPVVVPP